jgi:hypothetical protein
LRADVQAVSHFGVPTGSIAFIDNSTNNLGSYNLDSAATAVTPNGMFTLPTGAHSLVASYNGDGTFNASSSSPPAAFSITPASSSVAVTYAGAAQGANLTTNLATNSGGNPPTGVITFTVDGTPLATTAPVTGRAAVINPFLSILFGAAPVKVGAQGSGALLDSTLPNGSHTVIASYSGDANYAASTSAPFNFNLQPDFVFTANKGAVTIPSPGGTGIINLSISQLDNFTGTVSFACTSLPSETTCAFNPASIKGSGTTVLTVSTAAPRAALRSSTAPLWWLTTAGTGVAGVFFLGAPHKRRRWRILFGAFLLAGAGFVIGCGGGGSSGSPVAHDPGTPTGNYTVTVTATSGSLSHNLSFRLVVQ